MALYASATLENCLSDPVLSQKTGTFWQSQEYLTGVLGDLLLRGLYAFYTEHERYGEWEGGVEGEWAFNLLALHLD